MVSPACLRTSIIFKNEIMDGGKYVNEYHSVFRDGHYALMFSDFYGRERDVSVQDLENGRKMNSYLFEVNEGILNFSFPFIVSKTEKNLLRIWDLNSFSKGPVNTIEAGLIGIHKGVIYKDNLIVFSTQYESKQPKYMTIITDISRSEKCQVSLPTEIEGVDFETGILMHEGGVILSILFGSKILFHEPFLKDKKGTRTIDVIEHDLKYLKAYTRENHQDYENNIIKSFAVEKNTLVGATAKSIKVWDLAVGKLQKVFQTGPQCQLYSLEGRFLLGTCHKDTINIWDIATGTIVFSTKNSSSHPIPHCTLYKNKIYHVNSKEEEIPNIVVQIPCIEETAFSLKHTLDKC